MPAPIAASARVKCTYKDCNRYFSSEKKMRQHKDDDDGHDYCAACDKDYDSYDDWIHHKILAPDKHKLACRVCGEEFHSEPGLRRHIELNHKVDQKLPCLGCGEVFHRASVMVEHLEFGHCSVISSEQFMGHIVHKHLITELLKGGAVYERFLQKMSKFEAAQDFEVEGGVGLDADEQDARKIEYPSIKPEVKPETPVSHPGPYPPLASSSQSMASDLSHTMGRMSLAAGSDSATAVGSTKGDSEATSTTSRQIKPWGGRSSKTLFSGAKPTPAPSEFSVEAHDKEMEQEHGINIMKTRFWDPLSIDFDPERFFEAVSQEYLCPFPCEQAFKRSEELKTHILKDHRIRRVKCPACLKYFQSVTALMAHCESRGSRCQINKSEDFSIFLNKLTGGFLSVTNEIRPDHLHNPTVPLRDPVTGRMVMWTPPTAKYLAYQTSKPADWKDPTKVAAQIGGGEASGTFSYQGQLSKW